MPGYEFLRDGFVNFKECKCLFDSAQHAGMRVSGHITMFVVKTMLGCPPDGSTLNCTASESIDEEISNGSAFECIMCSIAMKAYGHAYVNFGDCQDEARNEESCWMSEDGGQNGYIQISNVGGIK